MAQYNKESKEFVDRNNNLFDAVMVTDKDGNVGKNSLLSRYTQDAWGRQKSYHDFSVFSGNWTHMIPSRVWVEETVVRSGETLTITERPAFSKATSREGMLSLKSGTVSGSGNALRSKTFPRYQPNRGHLYSTAITCPNPTAKGYRQWGLATINDGIFFRMVGSGADWDLLVGRRREGVEVGLTSIKSALPEDFDASKGHVYDIQYEWRGVGNMYFFVDLELVHTFNLLGTLQFLSVTDPALGVVFSAYSLENGTELELLSGCVDVSSEGGVQEKTIFGSVDTNSALVSLGSTSQVDVPILAMKVPKLITYNGSQVFNSRGAIIDKLVTWTRDEAITRLYYFRDMLAPNLNDIAWNALHDSHMQYAIGGSGTALSTAFGLDSANKVKILSEWADLETKNVIVNGSTNSINEITPGDIIVVCINCLSSNKSSSATIYFSEKL